MNIEEIENRFTYHAPTPEQRQRYESIRRSAEGLALLLNIACPEGREKALAFTALEESVMWANASIARTPQYDSATPQVGNVEGKPWS